MIAVAGATKDTGGSRRNMRALCGAAGEDKKTKLANNHVADILQSTAFLNVEMQFS